MLPIKCSLIYGYGYYSLSFGACLGLNMDAWWTISRRELFSYCLVYWSQHAWECVVHFPFLFIFPLLSYIGILERFDAPTIMILIMLSFFGSLDIKKKRNENDGLNLNKERVLENLYSSFFRTFYFEGESNIHLSLFFFC